MTNPIFAFVANLGSRVSLRRSFLFLAIGMGFTAALSAHATSVGTFNVSGTVILTDNSFFWSTNTINSPTTGIYAGTSGSSVTIGNLNAYVVGTQFPAQSFVSFGNSLSNLDINFIVAGLDGAGQCTATPAPGQICTPTGSPFNFQNTGGAGSSVSWDFSGLSANGLDAWTGEFTSQFNIPYQTLLAVLDSGGAFKESYSGSFIVDSIPSPTPEPSSLLLFCTGLLGLAVVIRRKLCQ
jgi:hypothetical protein